MRLVASIGDGHTQLEPDNPAFAYWYPVRLYQFISSRAPSRAMPTWPARKVLTVAGRPIEDAMREVRALMGADNAFCARENLFAFHNAILMKGLGLAESDGSLKLRIKLRSGRVVDRVVIARAADDKRYDPDGSKVPAMIHEFIKREDNRPWKHLYVLTGRKTFSAAVMMLQAFADHTAVSLIGEPAGAGSDSYGDATTIRLPRIGAQFSVSTLYHKLDDAGERGDATPVDVPAPFSFADYAAGRDPAVDAILRGDEMRSVSMIALEDDASRARKIYEARKKRFAKSPDWLPPRQIDLIHSVWRLMDQQRTPEAAELVRLVTEIYPRSARAWSVRGNVEMAAGRKADALERHRRALTLDPNNIDNLGQRAALKEARMPFPD